LSNNHQAIIGLPMRTVV